MTSLTGSVNRTLRDLFVADKLPLRAEWGILIVIIAIVGTIRVATIQTPGLDRTMWKEIDYIEISRNYWKHGFNFFRPEITWPAEPPRVTAMEFPLVPYTAAFLYQVFGFSVYTVRALPLICWLLTIVFTYRLARREIGPLVALLAAAATGIIPLNHQFGRILFSEPMVIMLSVVTLDHYAQWADNRRRYNWWIAAICFSLAIALKIEPLFLGLPLLWITVRRGGSVLSSLWDLTRLILASLILPAIWYNYAFYLSRTSIDVFGVVPFAQGHNKLQSLTMLTSRWWYAEMVGRIVDLVSGKLGLLLFGFGCLVAVLIPTGRLFVAYLLAVFIYFGIVAEGNIDAPYRQLNMIPPLGVILAIGLLSCVELFCAWIPRVARELHGAYAAVAVAVVGCLFLAVILGRNQPRLFLRDVNTPCDRLRWDLAGEIKERTGDQNRLVTVGEYSIHVGGPDLSPVLYYYAGRRGWSLRRGTWDQDFVASLTLKGATHLAAVQMDREPDVSVFLETMKQQYPAIIDERDCLLLDLSAKRFKSHE